MRWANAMTKCGLRLFFLLLLCQAVAGCGDDVQVSGPKLRELEAAGTDGPAVDLGRIIRARMQTGPYRVTVGDVLRLELPAVLYPDGMGAAAAAGGRLAHTCRVDDAGAITLPDGRQVAVAGRSLSEIEAAVVGTYYPDLVKTRPSVYAQVLEYRSLGVQILGAVASPGIYQLRHDEMSLVSLLMEAGGIVDEGAAVIRITRQGDTASGSRNNSHSDSMGMPAAKAAAYKPVMPAGQVRCVRFRHEGPLATTGWLTIESDDEACVHRWLDIASGAQLDGVLREAVAHLGTVVAEEVRGKVSRLAGQLDSRSAHDGVRLAVYHPDGEWKRSDSASLVTYLPLTFAGGNPLDSGRSPRPAKTIHEDIGSAQANADGETTLALPVRGLNIPFADVPLEEGDAVVVERLQTQYLSVVGLVRNPGNFPYPHEAEYNLVQALAFAGGLDMVAAPRYVSVYRLKTDGTIASTTVQLVNPDNEEELTERLSLRLKPGDVVSVEHTPRTRRNVFLANVFRISLGLYFSPDDLWGGDDD